MRKFKIFLRFDKEEKWLEHMASQGWALSGKSLFYHFQKAAPESQTIRIDYRELKSSKDFSDYCTLFEDSGWKHIAGKKSSGSQYFKKISGSSTEDIFSDTLSRAGRYKRLSDMWLTCAIVFMPLFLAMQTDQWANLDITFSPTSWYFTPGLWELEGISFWWAFLFETPFALMRGIGYLIPATAMLACIAFALKAHFLYRSEILK